MIVSLLFFGLSWGLGVFGWAQIIGSIQQFGRRGAGMSAFTILLWAAILGAGCLLVHRYFSARLTAWLIGLGVSFLQILAQGEIH